MLPSPLLRVLAAPGPLLTAKSQLIPRKRCTSYTAPRISSLSINPRKSFQGELLYLEFRGEHKVNQKETPWMFTMIYPAILNLVLFPILIMTSSWRLEWSGCAAAKRWRGELINWGLDWWQEIMGWQNTSWWSAHCSGPALPAARNRIVPTISFQTILFHEWTFFYESYNSRFAGGCKLYAMT